MTITVLATGGNITISSGSPSLSIPLGTGSDRVAVIWCVCANSASATLSSATLGGGSISHSGAMSFNDGRRGYAFLVDLSLTGSQTFAATWTEAPNVAIVYAVLQGGGAMTFGSPVASSSTWTANPLSIDITDSAAGDLIVALIQENNGRALTPGSGDSLLGTFTGAINTFRNGLRTAGAAGTVNIGATFSGGTPNTMAFAVAVKEAGGGDTTPPTLTSPSGTGGSLTCSGSVSTDEGNGMLYAVVTGSATAPTASQVKAGNDHTGSAALRAVSQAVSATGTQNVASGSVTAGTRYFHYMHEDSAANQSTVASSSSFVVSSGGGGSAIAAISAHYSAQRNQ